MLTKKNAKFQTIKKCHDGEGVINCLEYLAEYDRSNAGVKFIHDNIIEPGARIGEHNHTNDE